MDSEAQLQGYHEVIAANKPFVNLLDNADFQAWRRDVVEGRLESIRQAILTVDRSQPDWKERATDAIIAYQECRIVYEALFTMVEDTVAEARSQIAKIQETQVQASGPN